MERPTLETRTAAASDGRIVGAQFFFVVLVSHGRSASRPVLLPGSVLAPESATRHDALYVRLPGSVSAPGSGTRHDARVRRGVSNECGSRLPMWRRAVRLLSVDAAAHELVLRALSVRGTIYDVCELFDGLGSALP